MLEILRSETFEILLMMGVVDFFFLSEGRMWRESRAEIDRFRLFPLSFPVVMGLRAERVDVVMEGAGVEAEVSWVELLEAAFFMIGSWILVGLSCWIFWDPAAWCCWRAEVGSRPFCRQRSG